jgi:hypothetical protein
MMSLRRNPTMHTLSHYKSQAQFCTYVPEGGELQSVIVGSKRDTYYWLTGDNEITVTYNHKMSNWCNTIKKTMTLEEGQNHLRKCRTDLDTRVVIE